MPEPSVYYTLTPPPTDQAERDVSEMSVVTMSRRSGTPRDGLYVATVPLRGSQELLNMAEPTLYYFIEATDDDTTPVGIVTTVPARRNPDTSRCLFHLRASPNRSEPCTECQADSDCGTGVVCGSGDGSPACSPTCASSNVPSQCEGISPAGCCDGRFLVVCLQGRVDRIDCVSPEACGWNASEASIHAARRVILPRRSFSSRMRRPGQYSRQHGLSRQLCLRTESMTSVNLVSS